MNWLFIAVLIFICLMGIYGFKKGIMRMIFSVAAFFVSSLAMIILAPFVYNALVDCEPVMDNIKNPVYDVVSQQIDEGVNVNDILEEYHLPKKMNDSIEKFVEKNIQEKENQAAEAVSQCIAEYICRILSYIIVFIIVRISLQVVGHVIKIFEYLPVIYQLNNIGGLVLGVVEAIGCIWLFFMVTDIFHATQFGIIIRTLIWENDILRGLYNKNPLLMFIK